MTDKERFIQIFKEKITRDGSAELLAYLCSESCDFFTAPASTRYHGADVVNALSSKLTGASIAKGVDSGTPLGGR